MTALTGEELLKWVDQTATGWRNLLAEHPEILAMPCDIRETASAAELLQHIFAVELRYAQRLNDIQESAYEEIDLSSAEGLFASHDQAMALLRTLLSSDASPNATPWEESIDFTTRSAGPMRATRRVVFVHLLMHSIRHYAQLATLVRQHGIKPNWSMDYLFMAA